MKKKTITYKAFGFPVKLVNVPMKKVIGEWVLDIDFDDLEWAIARLLIHKSSRLSGAELRFLRKFLGMTTTELGKLFNVTHAAVLKWENEKSQPPISTDVYIRLYILDHLEAKDKEFRAVFDELRPDVLAKRKRSATISIDIEDGLRSA